jgi:hypothetical protein
MNGGRPLPAHEVFQWKSNIFQPELIEVVEVAVRPGSVNQRRDRIDHPEEVLQFGFKNCWGHGGHHTPAESADARD